MDVKLASLLFIASLMAIILVCLGDRLHFEETCVDGWTCSCVHCPGSCRCARLKPELEKDSEHRHSRARKASRRSRYSSLNKDRQYSQDMKHMDRELAPCPRCTGCPDCPHACDYIEFFPEGRLPSTHECNDETPSNKTETPSNTTEKPKRSDIETDD